MLDFTSSLYLGFRHASHALRPWAQLTTGAPAALVEPEAAIGVTQRLATLQGCQRATLAASALHLFWDVFDQLAREGFNPPPQRGRVRGGGVVARLGMRSIAIAPITVIVEASSYPIALWGVACAAAHGASVHGFAHRDLAELRRVLAHSTRAGQRPVVVTDGICTCCGCAAPLLTYADVLRPQRGLLIVDDTQALGLLGQGGGGSLRHHRLRDRNVVLVSSLAKAFGVPMAAMSGSDEVIGWFEARSHTRVHCSPPSMAAIHAAEHALDVNETQGDAARKRLGKRVRAFQTALSGAGLVVPPHRFPVQSLAHVPGVHMEDVHAELERRGVKTVLHTGAQQRSKRAAMSFILTAQHRLDEIEQAVQQLVAAIGCLRRRRWAAGNRRAAQKHGLLTVQ